MESPELREAYRICRNIARDRARNFYYAFVALPPAKRNAICAVYAFMRQADDISDEPYQPVAERRASMGQWLAAWKAAEAGAATSDPVFLAMRDAQLRFAIPGAWLDQLVQGTTLDLDDAHPVYASFDDLYRYCYLVASVVGLVCIRIFGYDDPRAEKLAEETGIAFQLTNILRDVAEDAAMGRVYLPEDLLRQHGVSRDELLQSPTRSTPALRRPALGVLVRIYHRLLQRIKSNDYDVFSEKISVPSREKLAILAHGLTKVVRQKVFRA